MLGASFGCILLRLNLKVTEVTAKLSGDYQRYWVGNYVNLDEYCSLNLGECSCVGSCGCLWPLLSEVLCLFQCILLGFMMACLIEVYAFLTKLASIVLVEAMETISVISEFLWADRSSGCLVNNITSANFLASVQGYVKSSIKPCSSFCFQTVLMHKFLDLSCRLVAFLCLSFYYIVFGFAVKR